MLWLSDWLQLESEAHSCFVEEWHRSSLRCISIQMASVLCTELLGWAVHEAAHELTAPESSMEDLDVDHARAPAFEARRAGRGLLVQR
jgi:hypothetical protein